MDPNLTPPPQEVSKFVWWIIGAISSIAAFFGIKWLNRQEKDTDGTAIKLELFSKTVNEKLEEFEVRFVQLENGTVTKVYVDEIVDNVKIDFRSDHKALAENLGGQIAQSEERMTDTVSACNQALRSEMAILHDQSKEQNKMLRSIINILKEKRSTKRRND